MKPLRELEQIEAAFKEWALDHYENFECWPYTFIYCADDVDLEFTEAWCEAQYEKHNYYTID